LSTQKPPKSKSIARAPRHAEVRTGGGAPARRAHDPHFAREAERYENPLPSRELILDTLAKEGIPVHEETLCQLLHIEPAEVDSFRRRLRAMEREGQIMRNRKDAILVAGKLDLVAGRVEGHPDGYGFLVPDEGGPDMFLSEKEMRKVLHGDRVMARASGVDRRGRPEGAIVEIISRANTRLVGRLHKPHGIAFVAAENRRISQDILIPAGADMGAKPGQVVTVEIVAQPDKNAQPAGRIVEVLGNYADPGMEIEIALRKHELPYDFAGAALRLAEKLPDEVRPNDAKGREDLRALGPLVDRALDLHAQEEDEPRAHGLPQSDREEGGHEQAEVAFRNRQQERELDGNREDDGDEDRVAEDEEEVDDGVVDESAEESEEIDQERPSIRLPV